MNRFEIAEELMARMEATIDYQSAYAMGLRAILAAALSEEENDVPRTVEAGFFPPGKPAGQRAWLLLNAAEQLWVVLDEIDADENTATPTIRLLRPHPGAQLRYEGRAKPRIVLEYPDGTQVDYMWRTIRALEDNEDGWVREALSSRAGRSMVWVKPPAGTSYG